MSNSDDLKWDRDPFYQARLTWLNSQKEQLSTGSELEASREEKSRSYFTQEKNPNGVRSSTHKNTEESFKQWHRNLACYTYASDLDLIEYRYRDGNLTIVALLELKRAIESKGRSTEQQVRERIREYVCKPVQLSLLRLLSAKLSTPAYLVLYTLDNSYFYVVDLLDTSFPYVEYSAREMKAFIEEL